MKRRYRILWSVLGVLALAVIAFGVVISRNADCAPAPALPEGAETMRAVMYRCYGGPEVLALETVAKPEPAADEVLVRVHAAAANPLDWHYMRGAPYIMRVDAGFGRPKDPRVGVDYAGVIEAVGADVTRFKPGDEVFGAKSGAFGEYIVARAGRSVVHKPPNVTFEEAAGVPVAALTALQALRDAGRVKAGERVLINGASGGVGTFAVQIAKVLGAEVTGVCSTRNVELVRSIGADDVIDYTKENYTEGSEPYDVIVDMVGNHPLLKNRRVLEPDGRFVIIGGPSGNWLGPLASPLKAMVISPFVSQEFGMMISKTEPKDLAYLRDLLQEGKIRTVIDRTYPLEDAAEAIRYLETGRARGKVIIQVAAPPATEPAAL